MNEIRLLFDRAVHSAEDRRYEAALLGALDGSSLSVPGRTGYVYARRGPNGELGEIIAKNTKVAAAYGLPVKMRLEAGQWIIHEAEGQFSDPDVDPGESGVYPHATTHQHGGSDEVATATPGANAVIKADADGKIGAGWIDDADIDHGSIGGLADDDHTQYHNDTRGDLRYAPIAKGVTNGDSHDHSGGDGAQIDHGGLAGLSDDDHAIYALLAGRSGGQRITGIASTGYALEVYRDLAAASTAAAVFAVTQDNSGDDQAAVRVQQDGTGDILTLLDGATEVLVVEDGGVVDIGSYGTGATAFGGTPVLKVAGDANNIVSLQMQNKSTGTAADTRFAMFDSDKDSYLAFAMPGKNYSGTLFGVNRKDAGFLFTNWTTLTRMLVLGTVGATDVVFGTTNTERARILSGGGLVVGLSSMGASVLGVKAGTSSNDAAVGGALYSTSVAVGNVGTGEDTLVSYTVPANTLSADNQAVTFKAWGTFEGIAEPGSYPLKIKWGSDTIATITLSGTLDGSWYVEGTIMRSGAATQKCEYKYGYGSSGGSISYGVNNSLAQTLSSSVAFVITGEGTNNNDITVQACSISWEDDNT